MSKRPRRDHSAAFKAKVAIEALGDGKTRVNGRYDSPKTPDTTRWAEMPVARA